MNLLTHPDLVAALAVERHGRFVAEAESSRRMSQLRREGSDGPLAPRFAAALRRLRLGGRTSWNTKGETMDSNTFDSLSRTLAGGSTRRRFNGALAAFGLGSIASLRVLGADAADARKKGKGKKKVTVCHDGQTIRVAKRALKKHLRHGATRGECPTPEAQCVPDCTGPLGPKECGSDGCGGTCGTCPQLLPICSPITFTCEPIIP
jgi:hypothetical protein